METFDFPYFLFSEEFPESSERVQFGKGYEFASKPEAPDQVIYRLSYPGLWFFRNPANPNQVSLTIEPKRNFATLRGFYQRHRLFGKFIFQHPIDGNVIVRFRDPLVTPKGVPNGQGLVEPFEIKLRLQP